jgi:hypothetical protein
MGMHFVTERNWVVPVATAGILGGASAGVLYAGYKGGDYLIDKFTDDGVETAAAAPVQFANNDIARNTVLTDDDMMISDLLDDDIMDSIDMIEFI